MIKKLITVLFCLILICGCGVKKEQHIQEIIETWQDTQNATADYMDRVREGGGDYADARGMDLQRRAWRKTEKLQRLLAQYRTRYGTEEYNRLVTRYEIPW